MTSRKKALIKSSKKRGFFMPWGHLLGGLAPDRLKRMIALGVLLILYFLPFYPQHDLINFRAVAIIESSELPFVIGGSGEIGRFQISPILLKEYNRCHKSKVWRIALFLPWVNTHIAHWYLTKRIPQMLRYSKKEIITENMLITYNAGVKYVGKNIPKVTQRYLAKYKRLTKK